MERDPTTLNPPRPAQHRTPALLERQELTAIFAGGFIGAIARAGVAQALPVRADQWPWATFAVNIAAALALGLLVTRPQERLAPFMYRRAFLATGLCGALSTFSTMMLELLRMIDGAHWGLALGYAAGSLAGGFAAVFVASKLVRRAGLTR